MDFEELNLKQMILNKESDRLTTLEDEWESKIRVVDANLQIVNDEYAKIDKEYVTMKDDLSKKRKELMDLESSVRKALYQLRKLKSEKKSLNSAFWRAK
jgi:chromosome segregation ATPase